MGDIHLATGTGEQQAAVTAEESVDAAALDMERETARTQHEVRRLPGIIHLKLVQDITLVCETALHRYRLPCIGIELNCLNSIGLVHQRAVFELDTCHV